MNKSIAATVFLVPVVLLSAGCAGPTAILSPVDPYDFRYSNGSDAESVAMKANIAALDSLEKDCETKAGDAALACRNQIVTRATNYMDYYWIVFYKQILGRYGIAKTSLETTIATLSAGAAITTPASAASIVSAAAASLAAFSASAEKNFFNDQSVMLLVGQMDADRTLIAAKMATGLTKSITEYTLFQARRDLTDYSLAMSVAHAMISMSQAGSANAQKLKDAQANVTINAASGAVQGK